MKAAICVGHSRSGDDGAVSVGGVSEWKFNSRFAQVLAARITKLGHSAVVIDKYSGGNYYAAMTDAAKQVKAAKASVAIELHFNSSDSSKANGHEWLYWSSSEKSKKLALWFDAMFDELPLFSRGILPRFRSDRGAAFLRLTHCPAIICEPFFGSNAKDWKWANENFIAMVDAMAMALIGWNKEVAP
jgi:N-acetylmuramoyl-L-alanine amidase